jgi:hypothetical protein
MVKRESTLMAAVVHNQHNLLFSACLLWKTKVADNFLLSNRGRDNFRIRGTFTHYHLFWGRQILDQLFEYQQIKREAEFGARLLWSPTGGDD